MTILDQPIAEEEGEPVKRKWTWFEKIFPGLLILVAVIREIFSALWAWETIAILGSVVALCYLLAYYWIDKPSHRTARTVIVSILYGLSFSAGIFAFMFLILFLNGAREMAIVAGLVFVIVVIIDFVTAARNKSVGNSKTMIRAVALGAILILLCLIPENKHIEFTYRKYPDFVNFYKEHQGPGKFTEIWDEYFRTHPHPGIW